MSKKPLTKAHLTVHCQSFATQCVEGEITAGDFVWQFTWAFGKGELRIEPSLGRALIQDALLRFLVRADYHLEAGGDYIFTIRAKF